MASAAGKTALVPLVAITVILAVSGVHGRHTHDPDRAARALAILAPTEDARVATAELRAFFETGWVDWDVKTAVEIACGTTRGRNVPEPVSCVAKSREIVYGHECNEEHTFRRYTWLAWSAVIPGALVLLLGAAQLFGGGAAKKKKRSNPKSDY